MLKFRGYLRQLDEVSLNTEDMTGMSQKSGDKRSTDSGAGMTAKGVAKPMEHQPKCGSSTNVSVNVAQN